MGAISSRQAYQEYVMESPQLNSTRVSTFTEGLGQPEETDRFRNTSESSVTSSSSSSSSKTLAESDLSIPLSQQVFGELDQNKNRYAVDYNYGNLNNDLRGHDNNMYQIDEEEGPQDVQKVEIVSLSSHLDSDQESVLND